MVTIIKPYRGKEMYRTCTKIKQNSKYAYLHNIKKQKQYKMLEQLLKIIKN